MFDKYDKKENVEGEDKEENKEGKKEEKKKELDFVELLYKQTGAPTEEEVESLKQKFGEVYVSAFDENEVYVWRPILRHEYLTAQKIAQERGLNQFVYQEMICSEMVLWPPNIDWNSKKAGTVDTIYEQIMQQSNFAPPALAAVLMKKL